MPNPAAPTNFVIARAGIDNLYQGKASHKAALKFTWTNNQPGATHRIQRKIGANNGADLFIAGDGQSSAAVHGLSLNTSYSIRIRAQFPDGSFSEWVDVDGAPFVTGKLPTAATQMAPPTNLAIAKNDYRGVLLTWLDNAKNEGAHIVSISGPGLPDDGVEIYVDHLDSGSLVLPLGYPFTGAFRLQHSATYSAKVKCRGGKQTLLANTLETDWTAEVSFTTTAPHIAIVNLPLPDTAPPILRGTPFSFRIVTNTPASSIVIASGALPAGFSLDGDTISVTTVNPDGVYEVTISAEDALTSDTQTLRLVVKTPAFTFTNLPTTLVAWTGVPMIFRLLTNTPSTSITQVAGALPAGLAFAGDTVSGTATATEGAYPVSFRSENALTSATGDLVISVQAPAIRVFVKPHGSSQPAKPGPDWGEVLAPLGEVFRWDISAAPLGPINVGNTITLANAPAWLALDDASLIGTPDTSGVSDVAITWSNGTVSGETTLRLRVKSVQITSADELTVYEAEQFQFQLVAQPRAFFSTQDDLPAGVGVVSPDVGDSILRGAAREVGDYRFRIVATVGHEQDTQDFTLHVRPLIVLEGDASQVQAWQGDALIKMLS